MNKLRIGTRGSQLALWQANLVRAELHKAHPEMDVELVVITTKGDKVLDVSLDKIGSKGVFTKEIEDALLERRIDVAVHSLKDLPTGMPAGLQLAAIMQREDVADALVTRTGQKLEDLPHGSIVMTGSLRRQAQMLAWRDDLKILPIRGNVPTRVRKFNDSSAAALVLACAGLRRLGMAGVITQRLDPETFLPACGQGAIAVQARVADDSVIDACRCLDHAPTRLAVTAERAYLRAMGGGCQAPLGAYARFSGDSLAVTAMAASADGRQMVRKTTSAPCPSMQAAGQLGDMAAQWVLAECGSEIMGLISSQPKPSRETP